MERTIRNAAKALIIKDDKMLAIKERMKAIQKAGFTKSEHLLIGKTGYAYDGYWTIG